MSAGRAMAVYCGAAVGARPEYAAAARALGAALARRGITVVYGGGRAGMMGFVADAALEAGGKVIGVITRELVTRELAHTALEDLRIVETMHERKRIMYDLVVAASGGFIALPGGVGTYDELFEIIAWRQLALHRNPIGLLDTAGFYRPVVELLAHTGREGFLRLDPASAIAVRPDPDELVEAMLAMAPRS